MPKREDTSEQRGDRAAGQVLAVIVLGYAALVVALAATWQMQSESGVVAVAFISAAVTGVLCADVSRFRASGPGMTIEASRPRKKAAKAKGSRLRVQADVGSTVTDVGTD